MPYGQSPRRMPLPALLLTLAMASCATHSTPTPAPPPVAEPEIPGPPQVQTPPPSGHYWSLFCDTLRQLQQRLRITQPMSGLCSAPGRLGGQG
jgi:hypothetical protein